MDDPPLLQKESENPRKIPSAIFIEKIEEYLVKYNPKVVLAKLQESYRFEERFFCSQIVVSIN